MKTKTQANIYAKQYIDEVFARRLLEEGFTCPNEKRLCWYRFSGEDVIQAIVFYSASVSFFPMDLEVGYGMQSLFTKPVYTNGVVFTNRPFTYDNFETTYLQAKDLITLAPYSKDIWLMAPIGEGRGVYTLDGEILPAMPKEISLLECYTRRKNKLIELNINYPSARLKEFHMASGALIDEAIFFGDVEAYPFCLDEIERSIPLADNWAVMTKKKDDLLTATYWHQRYDALQPGGREAYLQVLENRKKENRQWLEKQYRLGKKG